MCAHPHALIEPEITYAVPNIYNLTTRVT